MCLQLWFNITYNIIACYSFKGSIYSIYFHVLSFHLFSACFPYSLEYSTTYKKTMHIEKQVRSAEVSIKQPTII